MHVRRLPKKNKKEENTKQQITTAPKGT